MAFSHRVRRLAAVFAAVAALVATAPAARAAEPYEIDAILDLTGYAAFVGTTQQQALKALETYVNKNGGIGGRPLSIVVADDQSNPQVTVQLVQGLIAKHVPVILGPSGPDKCAAAMPLVMQDGPVLYCTTPNAAAPPGSYVFLSLFSADANMAATVRYLRERGWRKLAYLGTTDAAGQDAERSLNNALARPENASVQLVSRQHFAPGDLGITAQLATINAANPDALIAWAAGTPAGTLFHGLHDSGIDLPTVTSAANLNVPFFKQYGSLAPKDLYFAGAAYYGANAVTDPATKAALATLTGALAAAGAKPDLIEISAWDPGMLVVDALRKLGTDASAAKLRAYLVNLKGWVGANGPYDFAADPQHGLGQNSVVIVKWDPDRGAATAVSKFGGSPLPGK